MLTEKITEKEISFMESWYTPYCLAESLFTDFDNFGRFEKDKMGNIRLYQLPMLSDEALIDFSATAKYHGLSKKEEFKLKKNVGEIFNFGARLYGKSLISLKLDIALSSLYEKGLKSAFWSIDEKRLRGILNDIKRAFEYHPVFRIWKSKIKFKPSIEGYSEKNYWSLKGINITLKGKSPGEQFYQLHVDKMWADEVSFETEEVFKKRRDSGGELGCIHRQAGMTNFVRNSPTGKTFYDPKNKENICNLPRYANPNWDSEDLEDALTEFGGKEAPNFKIYVGGEIIQDGVSEIDMDRVEDCYQPKKRIKRFELKKDQFKDFENLIVVERPKNAERIFICADIGESAGTDITIFSEVGNKYNYIYNIIAYNFTRKEQLKLFKWLIEKLEANIIGIDCGDAMGRNLSDDLEEAYSKDNVVRYAGATKLPVGFQKDKKNKIILKNGKPIEKLEWQSEWSISRLKVLLYETRINIPTDYKLNDQLQKIISTTSGTRKKYMCISESGDHLFSSFRVFAISQWLKKDFNSTPRMSQDWGSGASSWTKGKK